jgi:hypothetical protein
MKAVLGSRFSVVSFADGTWDGKEMGERKAEVNAWQWRRRSGKRSAQNTSRLIYGVTLRVNFTELVSADPPPVVAFTVKGNEPVGVPGSLLLLVPPHEAIHTVERLSITSIAKMRREPGELLRELNRNTIPNKPGSRTA